MTTGPTLDQIWQMADRARDKKAYVGHDELIELLRQGASIRIINQQSMAQLLTEVEYRGCFFIHTHAEPIILH